MEKDLVKGSAGGIQLSISNGIARIEGSASLGSVGASAGGYVQEDVGVLLDKLFAAIEAASPPGVVAIEESVKLIVKAAASKI